MAALEPLERLILESALGDLVDREIGKLQNRLEMQATIEQLREAESPKALPAGAPEAEAFAERFWDEAGDVSESEVRRLYARAAVRSLQRPGAVSLNTLSVLRRMDSRTVLAFEASSRFVCDGFILLLPSEETDPLAVEFARRNLTFDALTHLTSVGLFEPASIWQPNTHAENNKTYAYWSSGDRLIRVQLSSPGDIPLRLSLPIFNSMRATSAALELWASIEPQPPTKAAPVAKQIVHEIQKSQHSRADISPEESLDHGDTWKLLEDAEA